MRRSDGGGPIRLPPSESPIWRSGRAWRPGGAASTTTTVESWSCLRRFPLPRSYTDILQGRRWFPWTATLLSLPNGPSHSSTWRISDVADLAWVPRSPSGRGSRAHPAGAVRHGRLPRPLGGPDPAHAARPVGLLDHRRGGRAARLDVGGVSCPAERGDHPRHPLRNQVVEAGHRVAGGLRRHAS